MRKLLIMVGALALSPLIGPASPASAAPVACSSTIPGPSMNVAGVMCADAVFVTGTGRVYWKAQLLNTTDPITINVYSKTGTLTEVFRGGSYSCYTVLSGFVGFATPTNTKIRVDVYYKGGRVVRYNVPVEQV